MTASGHQNALRDTATLRQVLETLNRGVSGLVCITEESGRLTGVFTDGDARRALLSGTDLEAPASRWMNREFVHGHADRTHEQNLSLLNEHIRHLPILDGEGRLVDVLSWAEMWKISAMAPALGGSELQYVSDCITSGWISSQGNYVKMFEEGFAAYHNATNALTTSSGTSALHLAMTALGIGAGDEVIVPDFTFGACANAVVHSGARPVFVDVCPDTWTLDPQKIGAAITPATRAIMAVHIYGHPCDMDAIHRIAKERDLYVIEDCAEALGARYKGRRVGTLADASCFSFFANKVITTGEGGMVLTNNPKLHQKMELLRDHGMTKERRYWHEVVGFNYRMTNIQAAIGVAQLEKLDAFLRHKRRLVYRYQQHLEDVPGIHLPKPRPWADSIYWFLTVLVDPDRAGLCRDELAQKLSNEGIESRPVFYPLHDQPAFQRLGVSSGEAFPVTDWVSKAGLSLPTGNQVTLEDVDRICSTVQKVIRNSLVTEALR